VVLTHASSARTPPSAAPALCRRRFACARLRARQPRSWRS